MMRRILGCLLAMALVPWLVSCDDDLPTWGLDHGELATLRLGSTISDLEPDMVRGNIYAADWLKNVVYVIDGQSDQVKATIPVGSRPVNLEMDPDSDMLYVALQGADAVVQVDPDLGAVTKSIELPYEPTYLAVGGDGRIYTGPFDASDGTSLAVDVASETVLHEFSGGGFSSRPVGEIEVVNDEVVVIARSQYMYTFDITDPNDAVLLHNVEIDEIDLTGRQMEASPDGEYVYVAGRNNVRYVEVFRIDGLVKAGEFYTDQPAIFVCLTPGGERAYVASIMNPTSDVASAGAYITGFDTGTYARQRQFVALGTMTQTSMCVSPDESKLYVVVDNPYRITENPYNDLRQDVQILSLR